MQKTIVQIVSPSFSGSTLLTFLLNAHSEIGSIGERRKFYRKIFRPNAPGSSVCSCGQPFRQCPLWSYIAQVIRPQIHPRYALDFSDFQLSTYYSINRLLRRLVFTLSLRSATHFLLPPFTNRYHQALRLNQRLIYAVLDYYHSWVFVDASKSPFQAVFLNQIFPSKIIFLTRDGRAQVYSAIKRKWPEDFSAATHKWVSTVRAILRALSLIQLHTDIPVYQLRYEDLCASPAEQLDNVFEFIGVDADHTIISRFTQYEHHIMGNFKTRVTLSAAIEDKREWKTGLSASEIQEFNVIGGSLNNLLGYS